MTENAMAEIEVRDEPKYRGKITKIHQDGWGFISSKDKPFTRIFFHWSGLKHTTKNFTELHKGMHVEFELISYKDMGWRAINIEVLNDDIPL